MYSLFCENLTMSLEFRDDIIDAMSIDYTNSLTYCNYTFSNSPQIADWWWDTKNLTSYGNDTLSMCQVWTDEIVE